ncbi:heme peroxidase [Viridothelium virens]|uniref:Peroxidase n=1 Tax=Viridothelium virens TaxID=1048519 RepID=A0A6A6HBK1_VIRVR|nr:heme peroxidase [Viridothelium virens]
MPKCPMHSPPVADVLALGTVTSVGNCGGPQIPYRGGRIDATGPGASGVPAPDTDLATTLSFFANAGFNKVDSIKLTACGHTLGSVHHGGFPTVMDNSTVSPNNTQGAGHLDSTNAGFDIDVVEEYVSGTGQRGGPLVTSFNESSRSDLRLYESDNNTTMQSLAKGGTEGFFGTCVDLLGRMLNTVPANVRLTDVVEPMNIKPVNVTFDIDDTGTAILTGVIRYLTTATAPTSLTISAGSATQKTTALSAQGSSIFGITSFYPFTLAFPSTSSNDSLPASLTVISEASTSQTYALEPRLFFTPSLSSIVPTSTVNSSFVNIVAALAPSVSSPVAVIAFPTVQEGTLAPKMMHQNVTLEVVGTKAGYSLVGGNATLPTGLMRQLSVDIVTMVDGMEVVDAFNFVPQI